MAIKHVWLSSGLMIGILLSASFKVCAEESLPTSYLMSDAPTFAQTINQFEQTYNAAYPNYEIPPYKEIIQLTKENTLYFASKINETLYSSAVVDSETKKIKSLQLTYIAPLTAANSDEPVEEQEVPPENADNQAIVIDGNSQTVANTDETARDYMIALIGWFNPRWTQEESKKELDRLVSVGRDDPLYQEIVDNLRYVVVDRGEKGITLAVEPIKQKLPEPQPQ